MLQHPLTSPGQYAHTMPSGMASRRLRYRRQRVRQEKEAATPATEECQKHHGVPESWKRKNRPHSRLSQAFYSTEPFVPCHRRYLCRVRLFPVKQPLH